MATVSQNKKINQDFFFFSLSDVQAEQSSMVGTCSGFVGQGEGRGEDQACFGFDTAKYKHNTCCWPWVFRRSSLLPPLVLSVLFCCRCLSLEAAEEWRTMLTLETFPP